MTFHGQNLLGAERAASGDATYSATDPTTGEALPGTFHDATEAEVDRAARAAAEAFAADRDRPAEDRADLLDRVADEVEALGDTLVECVMAETALPEGRVRGERGRTTGQLRLFARTVREGSWVDARIDPALPDREPIPRPDLRRMLVPLGPVAVFGASNFPLAFSVAGGDTASALAAGCPVVVKAHPAHPGTSELVAEAMQRAVAAAGFHAGTVSLVHGAAPAVSLALVRHPEIKAVGFTGSLRAGRALFDAASGRPSPIPVYAEMGSINPVFLRPGALAERAEAIAEGFVGSLTLGAGQFCTNPGLVVAEAGADLDRFLAAVAERVTQSPPYTMLHDGICSAYGAGVEALATVEGVRAVARGQAASERAEAAVFAVDAATFLAEPRLSEEVFGPSTLVVACRDAAEVEAVAASLEGHLTATLHATEADLAVSGPLVARLRDRVGRLLLNGFPTGVEVSPAMQHGGPYPATTDSRTTSVGTAAILRFARPVCYQGFPDAALPPELQRGNPRGIWRLVDGALTQRPA